MKKLNLKKPLLFVDGSTLKDEAGKDRVMSAELANVLAMSREGNPVKLWTWALALGRDGIIQVDEADLEELTRVIKESQATVLFKGQVLEELRKAATS